MLFALNYSPQAFDLVRSGAIEIDLFKCSSDFPEHIAISERAKPVYVHFSLRAGRPGGATIDFESIEAILKRTATPYVNIHLGASNGEYPDIPVTAGDKKHLDRLTETMIRDVRKLTEYFGPEKIIVESWPYMATARKPTDILYASIHPDVINAVIGQTGCGLLLDIDHARVAAHYGGWDPQEYIHSLPVDRIRELHMTGTHLLEQGWLESHLPMGNDDWKFFEWALGRIEQKAWSAPGIMAFEYGGTGPAYEWRSDTAVIAEQVPEFLQRISAHRLHG